MGSLRSKHPRPVVPQFEINNLLERYRMGDKRLLAYIPQVVPHKGLGIDHCICIWYSMPDRSSKRPTDPNELAKLMADIATGEVKDTYVAQKDNKNPAAVALGRLGGKKGGSARAASLTPEQRRNIAERAAAARWAKKNDG